LAAPDDDGPRLALADWCEQNGESSRARMIRMQLELSARARLDNPGGRAYELATDTAALARSDGDRWLRFDELAPYLVGYRYIRGCVELARLDAGTFVAHAPELFALAPIRHLDITALGGFAAELFTSPWLRGIRSLSLRSTGLDDDGLAAIAASPHLAELEWLSLAENAVDMPGLEALAGSRGLAQLAYVDFFGNPVDPAEQYTDDQGVILERRLPAQGQALEARHGPLRWLHPEVSLIIDLPPPRF